MHEISFSNISIERLESLPKGGWLAEICDRSVSVVCGDSVEILEDGIVEGCWDGTFEAHGFDEAENFFGSGLKFKGRSTLLVPPSHTLEALYLHERPDRIVASNSLAFLLERERLDIPADAPICRRIATLALGVDDYERELFRHDGGRVLRVLFAVVEVTEGRMAIRPRRFERHFADFGAYADYLHATLSAVFENGASRARRRVYTPVASVSSGYDSTACAALAAGAGCRKAVTLRTARGGSTDTGRFVAEALGLDVEEFERPRDRAEQAAHDEAEFLATGTGGDDLPLAAFEPRLHDAILVTGYHGDEVWGLKRKPNAVLEREDLDGASLTEFRLRIGCVHVPAPYIGALRHHEINRISNSGDMAAWRLGTRYDRSIPRRIAEDAGVPRHLFGQEKKAVTTPFFTRGHFSKSTQDKIGTFSASGEYAALEKGQGAWEARFNKCDLINRLAWKLKRQEPRRLLSTILGENWDVFRHSSPKYSEIPFRWSLSIVRRRYAGSRSTDCRHAKTTHGVSAGGAAPDMAADPLRRQSFGPALA